MSFGTVAGTLPSIALKRVVQPSELARNPLVFLLLGYVAYRLVDDRALVELAIVGAVAGAVAVASWRWPLPAFVALLAALPFLQLAQAWLWKNGWVSGGRAEQVGYVKEVVLAIVLARAVQARGGARLRPVERVALALLALVVVYVMLPLGPDLRGRFVAARQDAAFLVAFLIACWLPVSDTLRRRIEPIFIWVVGVVAYLGVWNRWGPDGFSDWIRGTGLVDFRRVVLKAPTYEPVLRIQFGDGEVIRAGSIFLSANQLGYFLLVGVGLIVGRVVRGVAGRLEPFIGLLCALCIVYTNSRSALVLLPVAGVVGAAAGRRLSRGTGVVVGVGVAVAVLVVALGAGYQLTSGFDTSNDRTGSHVTRVGDSLVRIVERPFGSGLGTSSATAERFQVDDSLQATENFYLRIGAQVGLLGTILMLALAAMAWRSLWRRSRQDPGDPSVGGAAAFAAVALGGFVLDTFSDLATSWWVFALAGFAVQRLAGNAAPERPSPALSPSSRL